MKGVFMKTVNVHWASIDDETALSEYVDHHPIAKGDWEYFCVKRDMRDWKIVKGKGDV
jgi:hypothetical protein